VKYNGKDIDPKFDGHPEKSFKEMTPREKIYYLWLQMEFRYAIRNRKIIPNKKKENKNSK
jgi:hypothetical protein